MWKKEDPGLGKAEAQALYRRVSQKADSDQKKKAREELKRIKQEGGQSWADYKRHNQLNDEGLPSGAQTLASFGKRKAEEKSQKQGSEEGNQESPFDWSRLAPKNFITLAEFLSVECVSRLRKKYATNEGLLKLTLAARSELQVLDAAKLLGHDAALVFKGDIGEVLAASARCRAGWLSTTHEWDSQEPGIDVISFAQQGLHVVLTEVKYWPSGCGEFTLGSLPVVFQRAVQEMDASVVRPQLIEVLKTRKELDNHVGRRYLAALAGESDVLVSWEIEIIGNERPTLSGEVTSLIQKECVTLFVHLDVTARLLTRAANDKNVKPAPGAFGLLKKAAQVVAVEPAAARPFRVQDLTDPDEQVEYGPWDLERLEQLPSTRKINEMKKILRHWLRHVSTLPADEQADWDPYFYNGVLRL
jgi:hypothetical protein